MGILFFNWYGYQLLSAYWQDRADRRLEAVLDADGYDGSQLISLKVPVSNLSYYNASTQFERVDGQIEVGGIQYKYVKRRLYGDSLELLCVPNRAAMKLQTARNDFFRQVNDLQQESGQGKKADQHYKGFTKDFTTDNQFALSSEHHIMTGTPECAGAASLLPLRALLPAENPPDGRSFS